MTFLLVLAVDLLIVLVGGVLAWVIPGKLIRDPDKPIAWGWSIRDIVVVAVLAAITAIVNTALSTVWQVTLALGGPVGSAVIQGTFGWGYIVAFMLVRKPGAMVMLATLECAIEALIGSPSGIYTLGWGISSGLAAEAVMAFVRWNKLSPWVFLVVGAVESQFSTIWTWYLYGWAGAMNAYWVSIPVTLIAGGIASGLVGYYIGLALSRTGLVRAALGEQP